MELRDLITVLKRGVIWILAFLLGGILLSVAMTASSTKIYTATAVNFVALSETYRNQGAFTGAQFASSRVKSYTELVTSPDVLLPVINELGLETTPSSLGGSVSASNPPGTVLLEVSASNPTPALAAQIANAVAVQLGVVAEQIETPQGRSNAPVKITLVQPAVTPSSPSAPNSRMNLGLGVVAGLGLGVGIVLLRHALDRTVKDPAQLRELTGAPSLGLVLYDTGFKPGNVVALNQKSVLAEGYRTIRTNLSFINVDNPPKAITVTSIAPGDGKTTTACNLAVALALAGQKVCLVEGDLRKPHAASYLGLTPPLGLTDIFTGNATVEQALVGWNRDLLKVLAAGPVPPNPSELLASQHMRDVLTELTAIFDIVIVDAPPLLLVSDPAIVASQTDGAIIVARHGRTTRDQVVLACEALGTVGARILGTVLNAVPPKDASSYGYYGYGYYGSGEQSSKISKRHMRKAARDARKRAENSDGGDAGAGLSITGGQ